MPTTVEGMRQAVRTGGLRDMYDREAREAGKKCKYAGLWLYERGRSLDFIGGRPTWSAVVAAPPTAAGKLPPRELDVYRSEPEPFFALHNFGSEAEAALAHDYATLWLRLRCPGCTLAKLRQQKWNKPKLRVWEDAAAVGVLARLGLDEVEGAQQYIRTKMLNQMFVLSKRGMLPKQRAQELHWCEKERDKWRVQCQRDENRARRQWEVAERAGEAAQGQAEAQHAQRERAACRLLAQLQRLQGVPSAAEARQQEERRQGAEAKRRAQAEARTAEENRAEMRRRAAATRKRFSELRQQEAVARKRQVAAEAEASRQQKRQRVERLAARSGKRRASL